MKLPLYKLTQVQEIIHNGESELLVLDKRGSIEIWDVWSEKIVTHIRGNSNTLEAVTGALSFSTYCVGVGFNRQHISLIDLRTRKPFGKTVLRENKDIYKIAFNNTGSQLVVDGVICNKAGDQFLSYKSLSVDQPDVKKISTPAELSAYLGDACQEERVDFPQDMHDGRDALLLKK